jgi:hypothetical protein
MVTGTPVIRKQKAVFLPSVGWWLRPPHRLFFFHIKMFFAKKSGFFSLSKNIPVPIQPEGRKIFYTDI